MADPADPGPDPDPGDGEPLIGEIGSGSRAKTLRSVVIRVIVVVVVLGLSGWLLFNIFEELDWSEIRAAVAQLSDAEWL